MNTAGKAAAATVAFFAFGAAQSGEFRDRVGPALPGQYVVLLDRDPGTHLERLPPAMRAFLSAHAVTVADAWNIALNGFVTTNTDRKAAIALAGLGGVDPG